VIGLDTNLLVRFFTRDDPVQAARAVQFLEANCSAADPGFVNHVVLCELIWVLRSSYGYDRTLVADLVELLLQAPAFRIDAPDLVRAALAQFSGAALDFADALTAAINVAYGCVATATFEREAGLSPGFVMV
jgi:predicted nucleic-acid-binding protein